MPRRQEPQPTLTLQSPDNPYGIPEELKDFRNFLFLIWQYLGYIPGEIQYDVADFLQNGGDKIIVMGQRDLGKSYITAAYVSWRLLWNPDSTYLVISMNSDKAKDFIRLTRRLIEEVPILQHLRPKDSNIDNTDAFDVGIANTLRKAKSVSAFGVGGGITGDHVDEIIVDDAEQADNSLSATRRMHLLNKLTELAPIQNPGGRTVFLGTPHSEESIYWELEKLGFIIRKWPAYSDDVQDEPKKSYFTPYMLRFLDKPRGTPTYPERHDVAYLIDREARMGPSKFALQYRLSSKLSDELKYPLKLKNLIVIPNINIEQGPSYVSWQSGKPYPHESFGLRSDYFSAALQISNEFYKYERRVMAVDPAGMGSNEVGYTVGLGLNGLVYLPGSGMGGLKGGYEDENLFFLAEIAFNHRVNSIVIERNFGDGMFGKMFSNVLKEYYGDRDKMPPSFVEPRAKGQKEVRIITTIEPIVSQHRVVIDEAACKNEQLWYQFTRLTREKGSLELDDRVDSLEMLLGEFSDDVNRNVDDSAEAKARKAMLKELARLNKLTGKRIVSDEVGNSKFIVY